MDGLCTVFQEVVGTDAVNAPVKTRRVLYQNVPYRSRHLSASEKNASGGERARSTHRFYLPFPDYPMIDETCRILTPDGGDWDIYHADNVDSQGIFWEIDARLASLGNAEVTWSPVVSQLTAAITSGGTWTAQGFLPCTINDDPRPTNLYAPVYSGTSTGMADSSAVLPGTIQTLGHFTAKKFAQITVNGATYWIPVYQWDSEAPAGELWFDLPNTSTAEGTFTAAGYVCVYVGDAATVAWIPIYTRA